MSMEKLSQFRVFTDPDRSRVQQLYVCGSPSLAESRNHFVDLPLKNFVTLIVADFGSLDLGDLAKWTKELAGIGSRYFCAWGNLSDQAHKVFDEECSLIELDGDAVIMTTDHRDDPLEESIWYALNCAVPAPPYDQDWDGILAVSIDDAESLNRLRNVFSNPDEFCDYYNT